MDPFHVEKLPLESTLLLIDGSKLRGLLYLAPCSPQHSGAQTPADLMAEPGPVLPFQEADGRFLVVGKASVAAVRLTAGEALEEELIQRAAARIRLTGGHELAGSLLAEKGAGERASDLLNAPRDWFLFEGSEGTYWVTKRHLLTLEPIER